jgi:hypothetical protein
MQQMMIYVKKVHYLMIGLAMRAEPAGSFGADPPVR